MARYRKILIATDGSDSGNHALHESFKLANDEKCWITVISVVPPYEGDLELLGVGNPIAAMQRPCKEALAEAERIAREERTIIKTVCEQGETHDRIVEFADSHNCDLIVMGRRGQHHLERALIGNVTARVIGYSHRDVLIVPRNAIVGWRRILVATDGSRQSRSAVDKAIDFAKSYGGDLLVLSVVDVPPEVYGESPALVEELVQKAKGFVDEARGLADAAGVSAKGLVREGEAFEAVVEVAVREKADTIVMGSHGRTGLKRLLMGSVTERVIGHAPCPVLVVKT